ncbi:MAG: RNA polymerase sporulation sigma factor SigE [Dethiobacteria bacterium]|nr:RNA polymerase sporulation sigma factor SigE [Bacillota bacterium]
MSFFISKIRLTFRLYFLRLFRFLKIHTLQRIYYISNSEALPPPLTNEEEGFLLGKLKKGDSNVRTVLIERNLRLVVYIARKFENTGINIDDLVSIGTIGLIKAVNTFDPHKNIKLATYASKCIENEILMFLRRNNKVRAEISFDEPLNVDWDGNELLLSDVLGTESDLVLKNIEYEVDRRLLQLAMNKLSVRERKIMELRFGLGNGRELTQKEVAELLGISQSYISRLEKRIINRLKKEIKKME